MMTMSIKENSNNESENYNEEGKRRICDNVFNSLHLMTSPCLCCCEVHYSLPAVFDRRGICEMRPKLHAYELIAVSASCCGRSVLCTYLVGGWMVRSGDLGVVVVPLHRHIGSGGLGPEILRRGSR